MPSLLSSLDRCSWTSLAGGEAHIRMVVRSSTLRAAFLRCLMVEAAALPEALLLADAEEVLERRAARSGSPPTPPWGISM